MTLNNRTADHPVDPRFLERWSPRAFDGSAVSHHDLLSLFEAARWAPSSFNVQPWRFLYAHRDTPDWPVFLAVLAPFNRAWAENAGVLVVIVSDTVMPAQGGGEPRPSHSHSFDAGAAWAMLALQAQTMGLITHGMTGVDFDAARDRLTVPERFRVEAAIAIGRRGDPASLAEPLRGREHPSGRRPVHESAFAGAFPAGSA